MKLLSSAGVRRLLHNKYVAILGDYIQRSVNKDLVKILQNDEFRNEKQLKGKVEMSFANNTLGDLWDVIRYHEQSLQLYKTNLDHLFIQLTEVLSPKCLVICNMFMSVRFKAGEVLEYPIPNERWDIIEGNFYSATLADLHQFDVIDMHFHLRFELRSRVKDVTHLNQLAHQKYTCILMAHIKQALGVQQEQQEEKVVGSEMERGQHW
uniref:Spindle pole body component n=1 Tax=Pyxicephalus adspersus TaxID=30357 RepID=A0AAV3A9E8_PYXAD|nr:TPA: hypothetical protein GDO54_017746 [Pyxicephalus adspersus]